MVIDSQLDQTAFVRRALHEWGAMHQLDEEWLSDVLLAFSEALNNTIIHSYHREAGHEVALEILLEEGEATFIIRDRGTAMPSGWLSRSIDFDPDDLHNLPEGGMGMALIESIMDHIEYSSDPGGVNSLVMKKKRP